MCPRYHLATGGDDNIVHVWDVRKHAKIYSIPSHTSLVSHLKFQGTYSACPCSTVWMLVPNIECQQTRVGITSSPRRTTARPRCGRTLAGRRSRRSPDTRGRSCASMSPPVSMSSLGPVSPLSSGLICLLQMNNTLRRLLTTERSNSGREKL